MPEKPTAIATARLRLEPLTVAHAPAMFEILRDPALYRYLDYGPPPNVEHVQRVYGQLEARTSPDGSEQWLNWIVIGESGAPIGVVQATINQQRSAEIAYVFARESWGRGYATEAVEAMMQHLIDAYAVEEFTATVDEANERSVQLLARLGMEQKNGRARKPALRADS